MFFLIIVISLLNSAELYPQQGKVDPTFNTTDDGSIGDGFDNTVRTLSLQSDEKLIVGGDYLNLNGISSPYLTRLNVDGSIDESFDTGTGFNGKVYSCSILPDRKIIIGGSFTAYNGVSAGRLIRLNADGSADTSFNTTIGATNGIIYKVCPQTDGKIILVGSFTKYNNVTVNRIARILPDGALDTSFSTGTGSPLSITDVKILADDKMLLTGNFTVFNGIAANRIVRLFPDGQVDQSFNTGTAFNDDVNAIAIQADGKIIAGGKFTAYNEITANRIIRLHPDGTPDTTFLSGSGLSKDAVQVIKIDASGTITIGGSFNGFYNNSEVSRLFFLNQDGTLKNDFYNGSGPESASVLALESAKGSWYIGGSFSVFDGQNQGRLAKINADGEYDTGYLSAGIGFNNSVLQVLALENKQTMVFGNFNKFNGKYSSKIARLLENGTLDDTFNVGQQGANNVIKTAVQQVDGKIIFSGNFTRYNESACSRIARILADGTVDEKFNTGSGFNSQVYAMAIQPDQKIIVGGNFSLYNSAPANRIIRLLPSGLPDASFNVGLGANAIIYAILLQPDGKILVGGRFTSFDDHPVSGLVRLNTNGSIDSSFNTGTGFDKNVYALNLQSDQKIIVGGSFLMYNGISQKRILRLHPNGDLDSTFDSGTGFSKGDVLSILIQPDDRILLGGTFSGTYKTIPSLRIIRLLKTGEYDGSFQAALNNKLHSMSFTADHKLMIGGDFNSVSGISKHRIARLKSCLDKTVWDGVSWSNGFPSQGKEVVFTEDYANLITANSCNCTINEGKTVNLLSGNTLGIQFGYSGLGTLILNDAASLYQDDDEIINNGTVHVIRKSSPVLKFDYTYWSSPVANQKLTDFSPNTLTDKFFSFNYLLGDWTFENPSDPMVLGKGYIIRSPQDFSPISVSKFEAIFKGIPNNGKISLNIGEQDTFNLIGNPYPSAINADLFLDQNNENIKGTLYFWTHNTPINNYEYASDDYAIYNLLGGTGTRAALSPGVNETIPDGTIASAQAFFAVSKNAGLVEFNNSMRIIGRNSTFFKSETKNKKNKKTAIEKHRIWLDLENSKGAFKQILIGYIQGASDLTPDNYNAESLKGNEYVDFYSILDNKNLAIQGSVKSFDISDSVTLGYDTAVEGEFTIRIDHVDGLFENLNVYIEDKTLKVIHNLKDSPYFFRTSKGIFKERFLIHYSDKSLKNKDFEKSEDSIFISVRNRSVRLKSTKEKINKIEVFDISGKLIYRKNTINESEVHLPDLQVNQQILFLQITFENNDRIARKFILH
ncbi:T9SS sorting signal type C domain-containing protein [Flavobacterium sp. ENC]|uniref:T9SS sorting signal type C domain-containing protein n=1 Tax=Flavobacterium sp. ENC TaxID=2897330 RepID=UPI001E654465|nr:T9SS sorting signal type C domain-containing protein [Flavobacterium sp. ENC]MCD0464571.1 T9SS sorting signal type C domain-containing protein [Flavobacterium sp. ENC]